MKKALGVFSAIAGLAVFGCIMYCIYKHFCKCCGSCSCGCCCGDEECDCEEECDTEECEVKKNPRHSRGYFHLNRKHN